MLPRWPAVRALRITSSSAQSNVASQWVSSSCLSVAGFPFSSSSLSMKQTNAHSIMLPCVSQPRAGILVVLRRQVRRACHCEQVVHRLVGAAEIMPRQVRRGDAQRFAEGLHLLCARYAPCELVVAHGGLVDARRLRDLPLGEPPQRPQPPQLLGEAVFLALPREERVSHLHRIPASDVR